MINQDAIILRIHQEGKISKPAFFVLVQGFLSKKLKHVGYIQVSRDGGTYTDIQTGPDQVLGQTCAISNILES